MLILSFSQVRLFNKFVIRFFFRKSGPKPISEPLQRNSWLRLCLRQVQSTNDANLLRIGTGRTMANYRRPQ